MHDGEELQDFLEGRLADARRAAVASHLERCVRCQRELQALRWVRAEVPRHLEDVQAPAELGTRVRTSLDAESARSRRLTIPRRAWIIGALAAAVAWLAFLRGRKRTSLPNRVAADFLGYGRGALSLGVSSADPTQVEAYFVRNGIRFPTRVYDLGMMQYQLVGGRAHDLDGRASAMFVYRGPDNTALMCQMYQGNVAHLPATGDVRENKGIRFFVHRVGSLTLVFWQEGAVVCVLVSDATPDAVVQLAFAKAVRVEPAAA